MRSPRHVYHPGFSCPGACFFTEKSSCSFKVTSLISGFQFYLLRKTFSSVSKFSLVPSRTSNDNGTFLFVFKDVYVTKLKIISTLDVDKAYSILPVTVESGPVYVNHLFNFCNTGVASDVVALIFLFLKYLYEDKNHHPLFFKTITFP